MKKLVLAQIKDYLVYESTLFRTLIAIAGLIIGYTLLLFRRSDKGFRILASVHRGAFASFTDNIVERHIARALSNPRTKIELQIKKAIQDYPADLGLDGNIARFDKNPKELLKACMIVLKLPSANEKGVLYCFYSYVYPLLLRNFDVDVLTRRYRIAIEPSWSGYCDPQILCLSALGKEIIVGVSEQRDAKFLTAVYPKMITADFAGNTWINTETFKPNENGEKKYDVIMVAAWAWYKRHWAFFKALKRSGRTLKIALVGYPIDMTKEDVIKLAEHYGVAGWIEIFNNIPQTEVARLVAVSRSMVLWSRREGSPRATIEAMSAGVPCIIMEGFNYGQKYRYINEKTGRYATDKSLAETILSVIDNPGTFNPRPWILKNMTPQASTMALNMAIKELAIQAGEAWTTDVSPKTNGLHGMEYLEKSDESRYADAYLEIESLIRPKRP